MPYPVSSLLKWKYYLWFWQISIILSCPENIDRATQWCFYIVYPDHCQKPNSVSFDHNGTELFSHEYMIRSKDTFPVTKSSCDHKNIFFVLGRTVTDSGEIRKLQEGAGYGQFSRDSPATVSKCQTKNHWRHPVRSQLLLFLVIWNLWQVMEVVLEKRWTTRRNIPVQGATWVLVDINYWQ